MVASVLEGHGFAIVVKGQEGLSGGWSPYDGLASFLRGVVTLLSNSD